jgi:hypothetical protein
MTKSRLVALIVIIVVLAGVRYQILLNRQTGTEEEQIAALIQRGVDGAEHNDSRTAVSVISNDYQDDAGMTGTILRMRVADELNSSVRLKITITKQVITTKGDDGAMQFHVRLVDLRDNNTIFDHDLTLRLRKEHLHRYLIFSTYEWRIISVRGLGSITEM